MKFLADIEQEADVRWLAEVMELPGVMSYGKTPDLATIKCEAA
jgi:predicted RNase H-like HicB family nuclease